MIRMDHHRVSWKKILTHADSLQACMEPPLSPPPPQKKKKKKKKTFSTPNLTCQGVQKPLVKNFSGHTGSSTDIQCTRYKNAFNKCFLRIVCQNKFAKIYSEKIKAVCNAVFFLLRIDLTHILPPVTAEGFDGSHHLRFAEWKLANTIKM